MKNWKSSTREENRIRYDRARLSGKEWIRYGIQGLLTGLLIVWLTYRSPAALPLAAGVTIAVLRLSALRLQAEKKRTLQYHFRTFLSSLHTTMAAGYSAENAVRRATADVEALHGKDDILAQELRAIVYRVDTQQPLEELFRELGERSDVEDIRSFGELLMITKRTGGSMDKVLESTWRTLCEKIDTAREVDAMIAAKRYEQQIMSLMPAGIILYLNVGFSGFLDPLYGNMTGVLIMTGCLLLYLAAFFLGRRMTRQESFI